MAGSARIFFEIFPIHKPSAWEEQLPSDIDAEAGAWIDWRKDNHSALLDEGDAAQDVPYLVAPGGHLRRGSTTEGIEANYEDVNKAKVKEIVGLHDLGCFKRWPGHKSNNIIDARWVTTWKVIAGNASIKWRLVVRGFKDQFQDLRAYTGKTSRAGQRSANAIAAEIPDFVLSGFDVSRAFAKGMAFQDFSELTGTDFRESQFDVLRSDLECVRKINWVR